MAKNDNNRIFADVSRSRTMRVTWADGVQRVYTADVTFDACTLDDVLTLALRSIVIDEQRAMRANGVGAAPDDGEKLTLDASTYGRGARTRDPVARAAAALNKLTPDQIAAIIARHQTT